MKEAMPRTESRAVSRLVGAVISGAVAFNI